MEGRGAPGYTELLEGKTTEPPTSDTVSTRLQRIAELAREDPERAFRSLAHHIDLELLHEAFRRTRKDGATGVDGQTGSEYEERLEENLRSLLDRFKSGQYKAPPVRRTYVPKGDGSQTRPIGIPTFEDKVLQRAVVMVLEAVYEQDFLPCSYGYRPGRSAHHALEDLWQGLMAMGGGWVLEVDIKSFFDTISHSQLREILDQRVRDGVLRRMIDKWLAAGVMEGTELSYPDAGTPQGGVVSPLLANIYLHEVLDRWFERDVKPRLSSRAFTNGERGSFDLLGFTHYWARSQRGHWVVKRKTAGSRFGRAVKRVSEWCSKYRHTPLAWQQAQLEMKLRGHDNYYGIIGNSEAVARFHLEVRRAWRRWLDRRSDKARMTWARFRCLWQRYPLPAPVVRHWLGPRAANP